MRYLELLIDRSRELSQNTRYDANSGVSQRVFTQFFQNAQDFIVREIINSKSKYFILPVVVPVVSGQEPYAYPSDIMLQGIDTIEWSDNLKTWLFLEKNITKDRTTSVSGYPYGYWLNRSYINLTPPLQGGYLRITYNKRPKRLEKRSALVVSTTGSPITSITIDPAYTGTDPTYLSQFQFISIVGKDGVVKVSAIPITTVTTTTITVPSYALQTGEAIAAGDYVLADKNTANIPDYDDICESFLVLHSTYQAKYGDSSTWSKEVAADVGVHAKQIIALFATLSEDVSHIPIVNTDFLALW